MFSMGTQYPNGLPRDTVFRDVSGPFVWLPRAYSGNEGRGGSRDRCAPVTQSQLWQKLPASDDNGYEGENIVDGSEDISSDVELDAESNLDQEIEGGGEGYEEEEEVDVIECNDPVLELFSNMNEENEFAQQMMEEEDLDADDIQEDRQFEEDLWDFTYTDV